MPHPTLRAVLASAALRASTPEIVAGTDRLDRQVRWVHVSEVREVAGLLSGGELLLSTGLAMRGSDDEAAAYVSDLVRAGATGLIVELGDTFPELPAPAVAIARQHDFPLIVVRRPVRFVEVTEDVHRAIVAEQYERVDFSRRVHERFTSLSLGSADAQTIIEATAELSGSSVVLEDLSRHVVAYAAHGRPAAGLLRDWERRSRLVTPSETTALAGTEGWLTTPVGLAQQRWGRLVVVNPASDQDRLAMVIERAAQALELGRMAESDRSGIAYQAQGGFLAELADAELADAAEAETRARALGLPAAAPYAGLVVRAQPRGGPSIDPMTVHRRTRRLLERTAEAARSAEVPVLLGALGPHEIAAVLATAGHGDDRIAALAEALHAQRLRQPDLSPMTIGVGPLTDSVLAAGAALRQARHVAEVAAALPPGRTRPYFRAGDVRLHGLIALLHDDPRVQAFAEAELDRLLVHEAKHDDGMLELLRQYLAADGNKTALARTSHRSRPALYKKLARLEQILGVSLDEPGSRLALGVALMIHDQPR